MPSKKKKYNARFPPARIKKIMQRDEEVGKVAAPVPVIISRALELFVESLIRQGSEVTLQKNARTLTTSHLKQCILSETKFDFLKDLVASVPDFQGEDEAGNSLPATPTTPSAGDSFAVQRIPFRNGRRTRLSGRRTTTGSPGPSRAETDDGDSDESESEAEASDEDDEVRVESVVGHQVAGTSVTHPHIVYNRNHGVLNLAQRPEPLQTVFAVGPSTTTPLPAVNLDEDYDT